MNMITGVQTLATAGCQTLHLTFVTPHRIRRGISDASWRACRFTSADWSTHFDGVVEFREEVAPVLEPSP